jgi:cytochrome P450
VGEYARVMVEYAEKTSARWRDGRELDISEEMMRLTLAVVGKTLFGAEVESDADEVGAALTEVMNLFGYLMLPFSELLEKLPLPPRRRFLRARARLDAVIYRIIEERRRAGGDRGDLLSTLLDGHDRRAVARRGDDHLPRRPRDDRQRPDVGVVPARAEPRGRGQAPRRA